jgi:DNA repair exonuclease SbcCD ATPase subunit
MTGGSQAASQWHDQAVDVAAEPHFAAPLQFDELDDEAPTTDRRALICGVLALVAVLGWLTVFALANQAALEQTMTLGSAVSLIQGVTLPLALIALLYLLAVRTSRSEASRFGRLSAALRSEQGRLETIIANVTARIDAERADIAAHADRLTTIGEDAAERLRNVADHLRGDIATLSRDAELLHQSSQAARGDMSSLISDMPKAQEQTQALTAALEEAGLAAHERAGALDAQIAALIVRSREADEVAGGAAQKLAAHLARVDGVSESASTRLTEASQTMTAAIDGALLRAAAAGDAARQGMEAQGSAMRALVEQSEAALARTGAEASEALTARVAEVTARLEELGAMLAEHETTSTKLIYGVASGIDRIDERFAAIDEGAEARHERLATALSGLATHAGTLAVALDRGGAAADDMIGKTETLMTALDATTREIEESLPAAFSRLDASVDASRSKIAEVAPDVTRIEREASAALDRLLDAEKLLAGQRAALDSLGSELESRLAAGRTSANDLVAAVQGADSRTREIAEGATSTLVEAMVRVRETAQVAADRAREALAAVVPDSAERLSAAVKEALQNAVTGQVEAQIGELAATAERAVASANTASDRLMRQMLTIAETSAQVEVRIGEARSEIEDADRDNFSRRVALLIESLNSTSIDVTKILSNDVTDTAWGAYLKGDRGVFTRRAVRLLDAGEVREITRHYNEEPEFRDQVNRYIHDFEAMLRNVLATRAGSPLGVTLLSSDMGKLYVALAQAIERLRT